MVDLVKLRAIIDDSGMSKVAIARKLNISTSSFWNRLGGKVEFSVEEVAKMCEILHITSLKERNNIFFATKVADSTTGDKNDVSV